MLSGKVDSSTLPQFGRESLVVKKDAFVVSVFLRDDIAVKGSDSSFAVPCVLAHFNERRTLIVGEKLTNDKNSITVEQFFLHAMSLMTSAAQHVTWDIVCDRRLEMPGALFAQHPRPTDQPVNHSRAAYP
jgi:hypothetical protein